MSKRTSIIWTESSYDFQKRVNQCKSIADIVRSFGFAVGQAQYNVIYKRVKEDNIDISHIPLGIDSNKNRIFDTTRQPIEKYLVDGSNIKTAELKRRLIRDGIMTDVCVKCGLGNVWNEEKITLQLDHINGIRDDNRLENLRILCPNCHSQTPTFCGKHKGNKCQSCFIKIHSKSKRCQACANRIIIHAQKKFDISREDLEKLIWQKPTEQIARDFGVSGNAIAKRCKRLGIPKPPRGYWAKHMSQSDMVP